MDKSTIFWIIALPLLFLVGLFFDALKEMRASDKHLQKIRAEQKAQIAEEERKLREARERANPDQ